MVDTTELNEHPAVLTRVPMRRNRITPSDPSVALGGRTLADWESDHIAVRRDGTGAEQEWIPRHRSGPVFR